MERTERRITATVSGSFSKFKPEIDKVIEEMEGLGVVVLAPEKGWLYLPSHKLMTLDEAIFRPLPSELGRTAGDVEDEFLRCIAESDFLYIVDINGYIGMTVSMEIGYALARHIPIVLQEPLSSTLDPLIRERLAGAKVLTVDECVKAIKMNRHE